MVRPKVEWPMEDVKPDPVEVDRDCKRMNIVGTVTTGAIKVKSVIECNDFSS